MHELVDILLHFSQSIGYWGIILLMAIESSFIPFPSEIVIPPAAYLAAQGQFNIFLVVLCGIFGSLIGAIFNYILADYLGRPIVYKLAAGKWAKYFLVDPAKIEKAEQYFLRYGKLSTFFGRLVPAIRQLISIPAGFARMDLRPFILYTALGSGLWSAVLGALGYFFGANQELLSRFYEELWWVGVVLGVGAVGFIGYKIWKKS